MSAADDALRYARETYANGDEETSWALAAAALAQAEQLAPIADAVEGILAALRPAPQPETAFDKALRAYTKPPVPPKEATP